MVDFGKDKVERFKEDARAAEGEGGVLELDADNWERVKETKNFNLVNMDKMAGRVSSVEASAVATAAADDIGLNLTEREGDNLILRADSAERYIRSNKPMVGSSIGLQAGRWDGDIGAGGGIALSEEGGPEQIVVPPDVDRFGKARSANTVRMSTAVGREDNGIITDGNLLDEVGASRGGRGFGEGDLVDNDPRKSPLEPRKGKGGPIIKLGEKRGEELKRRRTLEEHRERRRGERQKREKEKELKRLRQRGEDVKEKTDKDDGQKIKRYREKARKAKEKKARERDTSRERERKHNMKSPGPNLGHDEGELGITTEMERVTIHERGGGGGGGGEEGENLKKITFRLG